MNSAGPIEAALQHESRQRQQHDEAECGNDEAKRQPETGQDTWLAQAREGDGAMVHQLVGL